VRRVLVVEDNAVNLELIRQILEDRFDIAVARDGLEGVEAATSAPPDVILMDISLPKLDGYGALARLRADERTRLIPVIAVSANAMAADRERGLAAGFDAYVTKPIDEDELIAEIERHLA
jgi:two-component system, cell cycle response regulator DivK